MSDDTNIHLAIQPVQLQRLYQVSKVIHSALDQQEALGLIVREAVGLVGATTGSVVLINPTDRLLEIQAAHGLPDGSSRLKLRVGEGITGWVAQQGKQPSSRMCERTPATSGFTITPAPSWPCH